MRIHTALEGERYPNCSSLADELEVSAKTIQRDIDHMRDAMRYPIEYDPALKGYYYTEAVQNLPVMQITEGEILALLVARKVLSAYRGTIFEDPLRNAFDKLEQSVRGLVSLPLDQLAQGMTVRVGGISEVMHEAFYAVSRALAEHRKLRLVYQTLEGDRPQERVVQPWHLTMVDGQWYLIAYCELRQQHRTFALQRIREHELLDQTYAIPASFSIEDHLANSFGIWRQPQQEARAVAVRLSGYAAQVVRERRWHATQRLEEQEDGSLIAHFQLAQFPEIKAWILSWGEHAELLAPADWRAELIETLGQLQARYAQARPGAVCAG